MKKIFYIILFFIFLTISYFIIKHVFPKDAGRFPFFVILLIFDGYLFSSFIKKIKKFNLITRLSIISIYWLPFILIIFTTIFSLFIPFKEWNTGFRTYLMGIIFIFYASKLLPMLFLLIADIIRVFKYINVVIFKPGYKKQKSNGNEISRSKFLQYCGIISGGTMFGALFTGMIKWVYDFRVRKEFIKLPLLPQVFNGLKIVQISDFHFGSWASKEPLKEAVQIINNIKPDLVFFTGDLVNYTTDEAFDFLPILKNIKARYGIFSILGNHDYGDYINWKTKKAKEKNMQQMIDLYKDLGWKLLRNENFILSKGNSQIAIIGVENWGAHSRFPKHGDLNKAFKDIQDIPVKLLLSHDPSHWDAEINKFYKSIDITFSGHTHGFQFGIELPGMRWSPSQYMYKQWAGLYSSNNTNTGKTQYIYVNRGIGTIGYPGRIGILPEITLFELCC
ncbi:MAG: metallophosphoesterase [Bacteroidales bacterium]|nr:metallophosphoesterase [Bacteroidales bacterium]